MNIAHVSIQVDRLIILCLNVEGRRITRNKEEMPASAMLEYMVKNNTNMEEELRISAQLLQMERERGGGGGFER